MDLIERLKRRAKTLGDVRGFFAGRGFLEVDPPLLVEANAVEAHIDPVAAALRTDFDAPPRPAQLHTSPELAMKRMLAAGLPRIYCLGHVFRDGERTARHRPEFTLVEWYRANEGLDALIDDCAGLLEATEVFTGELERATVESLWLEHADIHLLEALEAQDLVSRVKAKGHALREQANEEDAFFHVMGELIEPNIGQARPVVVEAWPARFAALARTDPEDPRVALRFELYFRGVELANAFDELTDPVEQRARFEKDNATRLALGKAPLPVDEAFLSALEKMPPASGIALGVDRLMMLREGAQSLEEVLYYPDPWQKHPRR